MALPSIAVILDLDIPTSNITLSEEETHSSNLITFEKTLPKILNVHDHIKFVGIQHSNRLVNQEHQFHYVDPHLTIFSPPPEA
ncbi:hypothetical protein [Elizabethkingia sp. JS20170427COW]|uniref:hypothetical protein n=1 Tax=Elizabethkingia sp. JS20170427COW TaxID=2583851 RepID=UPI0021069512|nr:hypothetical protein [Elizabethkingia sp. JS20170427COW]